MILISNRIPNHSNNQIIPDHQFIKYNDMCMSLGVGIDNKLNLSNHVTYVSNKLSKNTVIFYRIKDGMAERARPNFYYAFLYPYMPNNIIVRGGT